MTKAIVITYDSGMKRWLPYSAEALELIIERFTYIHSIEVIEMEVSNEDQ